MSSYTFKYAGSDLPKPSPEVAADAELFDRVIVEMRGLFRDKNNVYLSQFRREGVPTILSWIRTKHARIASVLAGRADEEGLTENFLDLAIYGTLGALLSHYGAQESEETSCRHLYSVAKKSERRNSNIDLRCVLCGETWAVFDASQANKNAGDKHLP